MHVFLTGAQSFIGKELIRRCVGRGIPVTGVDAVDATGPGLHRGDIRSPEIADLIPEGATVVHLAALSRDPDCRDNAYSCFDVNVMGTLNLIRAARRKNAAQFIFASTEWVYDAFVPGQEKTEDDSIDAHRLTSEYALSKYVSENNLRQQWEHGFCPVACLRFGIVYGPRATNWSAFEAMVNAVAGKDEVAVGSLATGRHFIHVSDVADGILAAMGCPGFEIINIQGDRLLTLGDIIAETMRQAGRSPAVVERDPANPSVRPVSGAKAARVLGWRPSIGLAEGVADVLRFLGSGPEQ